MESHECVPAKTKTCKDCGSTKDIALFRKNSRQCKECVSEYSKQHYLKNRDAVLERCKARQVEKKDEIRRYSAEWYERNKERVLANSFEYRNRPEIKERERIRQKEYYEARSQDIQKRRKEAMTDERRQRLDRYSKEYYAKNAEYYTEKTIRRRRKLDKATPPWADLDAIRKIYRYASRITKTTGIEHHVDHIIPINGKKVSGLHVESNLRVIPATENRTKSNRF